MTGWDLTLPCSSTTRTQGPSLILQSHWALKVSVVILEYLRTGDPMCTVARAPNANISAALPGWCDAGVRDFDCAVWHVSVHRWRDAVKLLLTSNGIANPSIQDALVDLLGKPVAESSALFIPTGIYPFPGLSGRAREAICGEAKSPLCELGWQSLGVLELTALPSIQGESWVPTLQETDALLVWGGNVLYLSYWMQQSGLADLLPLLENMVYVGVSAGSMATTPYNCDAEWNLRFVPPGSDMALGSGRAVGLVDFALCVHLDNPDPIFEGNSMANIESWAARVQVSTYAIDDQTALKVSGETVEIVSEGHLEVVHAYGGKRLRGPVRDRPVRVSPGRLVESQQVVYEGVS